MDEKPPSLITFVSATQAKIHRIWLWILLGAFVALLIGLLIHWFYAGGYFPWGILVYSALIPQVYYFIPKLKKVEFDEEFLYVTEKGFEVVIPLENIKDIQIKSLGGVYKITFYDSIQAGAEIFFKPSMIYPFDYKKQDEKVNILWRYINKAKQKREIIAGNRLHSWAATLFQ
jgi:hypothetical protein